MLAHLAAACRYLEPVNSGTVTDANNSITSASQAYTDCSAVTGTELLPVGLPVTSITVNRAQLILGQGGATDAA